jgi:signal transduction histidine kinase
MAPTVRDHSAELNQRAWEAIDSLVRTLGSTLNAREIAKRSLLTVTGQLLLQRAAFYVLDEEHEHFVLMECLGVRRSNVGPTKFPVTPEQLDRLHGADRILNLPDDHWLPEDLRANFQHAAHISEGNSTLGLLLLGGKIGRDDFDDLDRRLLRTMGVVMATTLQRSLSHQAMLEAKRRTEAIQRLQQQILDHVTHEFNTPLTVIRSSVDLMREGDREIRESAYQMHCESVARLQSLVQSIVEAGSATFSEGALDAVSMEQLRYMCLVPLVDSSPWRDQVVVQCHEDDATLRVMMDLGGLRTALDALLDNAWRFSLAHRRRLGLSTQCVRRRSWLSMDHRARIASFATCERETLLELGPQTLQSQDPAEHEEADTLVLEVFDAGIGIPANERTLIFEPFAQASNSPFRHVSGTGMGLMRARARVEAMQGEIRVVSTEGVGSLFAILLPLAGGGPSED